MLIQHIALVPDTDQLDLSQLARVSAALQKQVLRDVLPLWGVGASVDVFPRLEDVPAGYWPLVVTYRELGSNAGVHLDRNGQPFAQVQAAGDWSLDASRACLELLINPFENRTANARSLRPEQGAVEYLVEVSGPCADARNGYTIDDVLVSDFCTPAFFSSRPSRNERYSFNDSVASPLQLLPGGHMTWFDPTTSSWWLRGYRNANPLDTELGNVNRRVASLRELIQACAPQSLPPPLEDSRQVAGQAHAQRIRQAARQRAQRLRAELERESDDVEEVHVQEVHVPSVPPPLPNAATRRPRVNADTPPSARAVTSTRARGNTRALIVGSALAGVAVFALGLAAHGPLTAARVADRNDAQVVAPQRPAEASVAVAAAPATSSSVPSTTAAPVARPQPLDTRPRTPRRPRELPSPTPTEPAPVTQAHAAGVDDSLDSLLGSRH